MYLCNYCGEGNGTPLQYSCLEHPMDRGAWRATVHGVVKSWARLRAPARTMLLSAESKQVLSANTLSSITQL